MEQQVEVKSKKTKNTVLLNLPVEIWFFIITYLDIYSIKNILLVCKFISEIIRYNVTNNRMDELLKLKYHNDYKDYIAMITLKPLIMKKLNFCYFFNYMKKYKPSENLFTRRCLKSGASHKKKEKWEVNRNCEYKIQKTYVMLAFNGPEILKLRSSNDEEKLNAYWKKKLIVPFLKQKKNGSKNGIFKSKEKIIKELFYGLTSECEYLIGMELE
jgi:hypothetical protein